VLWGSHFSWYRLHYIPIDVDDGRPENPLGISPWNSTFILATDVSIYMDMRFVINIVTGLHCLRQVMGEPWQSEPTPGFQLIAFYRWERFGRILENGFVPNNKTSKNIYIFKHELLLNQ